MKVKYLVKFGKLKKLLFQKRIMNIFLNMDKINLMAKKGLGSILIQKKLSVRAKTAMTQSKWMFWICHCILIVFVSFL